MMHRDNMLKWLSALFCGLWLGCYITAASIVVKGGRWEYIVGVGNPRDPLIFGTAAFVIWQLVSTARRREDGRWKATLINLTLLAASVSLTLYGAEEGLRYYLRQTQGFNSLEALGKYNKGQHTKVRASHALAHIVSLSTNKILVYELKPNLEMDFGRKRLKTNSKGMRESKEFPLEKDPSTIRIVGVGDSGMFGWNIHQGENYMDVLEDNLGRRDGSYETLNLAVPGYNTYQEVEMVAAKGLAYDPDIVVVSWCDNDFNIPFFLFEKKEFREEDVSYLHALLFDRARFASMVAPNVRKGSQVEDGLVDPGVLEHTGREGVKKSFARLKRMGEEAGFRIVVVGTIKKAARKILEGLEIPYYNLRKEIPGDRYPKEYAVHFMHPRAGGHRVIAEHLEEFLDRSGWLQLKEQPD